MAQDVHKFETWYEETVNRGTARPPLARLIASDVCIVGGGLAGLTLAHELARAGKSVVLLEAKRLAWAASGRNGGFVSDGFAEGLENIIARVGTQDARNLYRLSMEGTEFVRSHMADAWMGDGMIVAQRNASGFGRHVEEMNRDYGTVLEDLDRKQLRALLDTPRYFSAIANPRAFHIHPLRYAINLAGRAERVGAIMHEASPVLNIAREGAGYVTTTLNGGVRSASLVTCVSALGGVLRHPTSAAVLPVATYVAVTEPLAQAAIRTTSAIADTRRAGDYYRLVDDGRILWGGRITTRVTEPRRLAEKMRGDMIAVYPQLGMPRIDHAWAGIMGYALHKMPLIGRGADGIWYATAFGGHGLNTTAMAGRLISRAIAAGDDEYRRFEPFGPAWAGGSLGRLGVQASYWAMQARDRIDEWRAGSAP